MLFDLAVTNCYIGIGGDISDSYLGDVSISGCERAIDVEKADGTLFENISISD